MARPEGLTPPSPPPRRRGRVAVALLVVIALAAAGGWFLVLRGDDDGTAAPATRRAPARTGPRPAASPGDGGDATATAPATAAPAAGTGGGGAGTTAASPPATQVCMESTTTTRDPGGIAVSEPGAVPLAGTANGSATVDLPASGVAVLRLRHDGVCSFVVRVNDAVVIDALGPFDGEVAFSVAAGGPQRIDVQADGSWGGEVIGRDLTGPAFGPLPVRASGRGPSVIYVSTGAAEVTFAALAQGAGPFVVTVFNASGATEVLRVSGPVARTQTARLPAGNHVIAVNTPGGWRLALS